MNLVDIVVPVYRGLEETKRCIEHVLAYAQKTPYELIVINDCSPEPDVVDYLNEKCEEKGFTLLHNEVNLGFVATVNRGMQLHEDRDVILLNSDTEVVNDWLDRLVRCAYADDKIGTVTPFSNNATICSYPNFCEDNTLPVGFTVDRLDQLFRTTNQGEYIDIPTAIGFCMYIRRDCLADIGYFDVETFGKGYGEENDFCMRVYQQGWRNVFCLDTFVYHAGNVSFGDEHNERKFAAMDLLRQRYPDYEPMVHQHIADDPAKIYRQRVSLATLLQAPKPFVLHITHNRGGGTERYIHELADQLSTQADTLVLRPSSDGSGSTVLEYAGHLKLYFQLDEEIEALVDVLQRLPVLNIHVHHTMGLHPIVFSLPERLGIPWNVTLHDYYTICPQITLIDLKGRYCGEPDETECNHCLKTRPAPGKVDIQTWRQNQAALLEGAQYCFVPSVDAAERLQPFYPKANIIPVYHEQARYIGNQYPANISEVETDELQRLKIVVIGALSPMKGADVLEELALYAKQQDLPLDFVLIGFAYRDLIVEPKSNLTVMGEYEEDELEQLLVECKADVAWFPALWPETYSYTLSAAMKAGLPIVTTDLGALPERLYQRDYAWVLPWDLPTQKLAPFFVDLLVDLKATLLTSQSKQEVYVSQKKPTERAFDYQQDYFSSFDSKRLQDRKAQLSHFDLEPFMPYLQHNLSTQGAMNSKIRERFLLFLVRLRTSPYLRSLVKRIPQSWQSRVKSWLLRQTT